MSLRRVWIPSPNYSSRGGSRVRLVVVHTAEGSLSFQSLGQFFANPASQVSSQTGIDDTAGVVGEYVKRPDKSWTQGNFNPEATSTELCAFAAWSPAQWEAHPRMLQNCADWIAEECAHFGIPIRRLTAGEAQGGSAGVCGHMDLGAAGGGHADPGPGFPWAHVLELAKGGAPATSTPAPLLAQLTRIGDTMAPPDYVINDVKNGSRKFGVYGSGLVRRLPGPEFKYCRDELGVEVVELNDADEGDRLFQYDQALRGKPGPAQ